MNINPREEAGCSQRGENRPGTGGAGIGTLSVSKGKRNGSAANVCEICNRKFRRRYNLEVHFRKHTGETPYDCPMPNCNKKFKWRSSMCHHVRAHHNGSSADILRCPARKEGKSKKTLGKRSVERREQITNVFNPRTIVQSGSAGPSCKVSRRKVRQGGRRDGAKTMAQNDVMSSAGEDAETVSHTDFAGHFVTTNPTPRERKRLKRRHGENLPGEAIGHSPGHSFQKTRASDLDEIFERYGDELRSVITVTLDPYPPQDEAPTCEGGGRSDIHGVQTNLDDFFEGLGDRPQTSNHPTPKETKRDLYVDSDVDGDNLLCEANGQKKKHGVRRTGFVASNASNVDGMVLAAGVKVHGVDSPAPLEVNQVTHGHCTEMPTEANDIFENDGGNQLHESNDTGFWYTDEWAAPFCVQVENANNPPAPTNGWHSGAGEGGDEMMDPCLELLGCTGQRTDQEDIADPLDGGTAFSVDGSDKATDSGMELLVQSEGLMSPTVPVAIQAPIFVDHEFRVPEDLLDLL